MKGLFIHIIFSVLCISAHAQKVSNIRAEQRGQDIVVLYSLETTSPCEVSLLLSQDNGTTWSGPLKNVSGDVGKNIDSGEKQIIWKVLEESEQLVGDKIIFKVTLNGKKFLEPEMILIEGGTFKMGSNSGESDEKPIHKVTLSPFYIGKFEVTQAQWRSVMGRNPSHFVDCDNCPVESVSWNDVQDYIIKLNAQTDSKYRLPTEAEWEYVAKYRKYNTESAYCGSNDVNSVAWYDLNSGSRTHPVGSKNSNELGLFDMSGNVWEWCSDIYGNYDSENKVNPIGSSVGDYHVVRGGSWINNSSACRVTYRTWELDLRDVSVGFRLVLPVE